MNALVLINLGLVQVKGLQNAGPKIKATVSLLKLFGIIVFVYK